ncbi:MAG: LysM peptidoglycan-binding domain-containing protein [Cytophagales bacterium]|jgi:LysM repeat protein|nr:LysM peptidoglycan-binding domain-containing protein [Cytophagales bacterium]
MKFKQTLSLIAVCLLPMAAFAIVPKDSVGVERRGKNVLVLHKVEYGETLFSLARRYRTSVKQIKSENPGMSEALKEGVTVKVPYTGTATEKQTASVVDKPANAKTHTVGNGEGLYAIARKYRVSVADLRRWNGLASDEIQIGQELIVSGGKEKMPETTVAARSTTEKTVAEKPVVEKPTNAKTHTVANGEGLYAIARKHRVSVTDLKRWNNLDSDEIRIGQELVLTEPAAAATTPTVLAKNETRPEPRVVETRVPEPVKTVQTEKTSTEKSVAAVEPIASVTEKPMEKTGDSIGNKAEAEKPAVPMVINNSGYVKTVENGMAEALTDGAGGDLFLALHRTAPVGTIMQIRNEMNDQSVFVKVIGKLPETGDNDKVIVKVSKRAYERLAAVDKRFRVQISYMPQQ